MDQAEFTAQKRGGRGVQGTGVKDDDFVRELVSTSTHDHLLFFTNKGRVYRLKGYEIPEVSRAYLGITHILRVQELCGLLSGTKEQTIPYFIIDEAKSYISESLAENKPFFTWINFWGPHTPCIVPEPYYSMYKKKMWC